jgi:hypothetical protein
MTKWERYLATLLVAAACGFGFRAGERNAGAANNPPQCPSGCKEVYAWMTGLGTSSHEKTGTTAATFGANSHTTSALTLYTPVPVAGTPTAVEGGADKWDYANGNNPMCGVIPGLFNGELPTPQEVTPLGNATLVGPLLNRKTCQ